MSKSQMKTMLITYFDITLNSFHRAELSNKLAMWKLCKAVHRKRPELWPNDWILHHHNAPAHKVLSAKQFLAQKLITEKEHLPYSSDLAANNFWVFQNIKSALKG
jgi:hypothetical protein